MRAWRSDPGRFTRRWIASSASPSRDDDKEDDKEDGFPSQRELKAGYGLAVADGVPARGLKLTRPRARVRVRSSGHPQLSGRERLDREALNERQLLGEVTIEREIAA